MATAQAAWFYTFDWCQGAKLETLSDGDWWETRVVQSESDRVMVHYVGGDEDEDEWIPKNSERLRPPQNEKKGRGSGSKKFPSQTVSSMSGNDADQSAPKDGIEPRPMRRSRILSDDARLAMQLQEEEVKVARGKFSVPQKRVRTATQACKAEIISEPPPAHNETATRSNGESKSARLVVDSTQKKKTGPSAAAAAVFPRPSNPVTQKSHEAPRKASCNPRVDRAQLSSTSEKSKIQKRTTSTVAHDDKSGMVSFFLVPDDGDETIPAMKRRRLCLMEDEPVSQLIRLVVDEVLPQIPPPQIMLRTPCGMIVGHDHSLRYVRNVLWPRSRGDLVLSYGIKHDSLL